MRINYMNMKNRTKTKKGKNALVLILAILAILGGFMLLSGNNSLTNMVGNVIYDPPSEESIKIDDNEFITLKSPIKENMNNGLILSIERLQQGVIKINEPVQWSQRIRVSNPTYDDIKNSVIYLETPLDASNIIVFHDKEKISDSLAVFIPKVKANSTLDLLLTFETAPVQVEIIEEGGLSALKGKSIFEITDKETLDQLFKGKSKKIKVWQNSSLQYRNIVIEMDIILGEKIVELREGVEKEIEFDYESGTAKWIIGSL